MKGVKVGTQFGTQKCAGRSVEAGDAVDAGWILLSNFASVVNKGTKMTQSTTLTR